MRYVKFSCLVIFPGDLDAVIKLICFCRFIKGYITDSVGIRMLSLVISISSVPLLHTEQVERYETC